MRRDDTNLSDGLVREAKAPANILGMTPRKWRLVRAFEAIVRIFLPLMQSPKDIKDSKARPDTILVIEYWKLGDLAILVPFLRNLRRCFPCAHISLLANPNHSCFLDGQGIVDEFIPVQVPWAQHSNRWRKYNPLSRHWISFARALLALRMRRFDWAFAGRMDVRDNFILLLSGACRRIGYAVAGGGSFLTDRVMPDLSRPHRADIWLHLLEAVAGMPNRKLDGIQLQDEELASARSFLTDLGIPPNAFLIGIHPGAPVATRRWGSERFAKVANRLVNETDAHVLWFSEPGTPHQVPPLKRCYPVSLSLRPFLAVLSRCRLFLCNDSGPMHLANLLTVPVIAIFGPQRPESFGPRGAQDRVVIRPEFSCRPCFDYCIFDRPYCLRTISTEEVYNAVEDVFRQLTHVQVTRRGVVHERHI